jgi:hypothetical protein
MLTPGDPSNERPCPFARLDGKVEEICARVERELWKSTLAIIGTVTGMAIVTALAILLPVVIASQ